MRSRILVLDSKEAEEEKEEAEQNLEIACKLLIDNWGWGGVVLKVFKGIAQVEVTHWGVTLGVRLAQDKLG